MNTEIIAALLWRFVGVLIVLSAIAAQLQVLFVHGLAAPATSVLVTLYMAAGVSFILFSRRLGEFIAAGL